jgi:GDP-D-mannose dehydratase
LSDTTGTTAFQHVVSNPAYSGLRQRMYDLPHEQIQEIDADGIHWEIFALRPWQKYVKRDPAFDRPTEPARLVNCSDKIRKILCWKPGGTFRELVQEVVEAELNAIDSNQSNEYRDN